MNSHHGANIDKLADVHVGELLIGFPDVAFLPL